MARKDYKKLLVDRGRVKWHSSKRIKDNDMSVDRAPIRNNVIEFMFNDYLNPLFRFLQKQVGRPWHKVYSELCSQADARSLQGHHLRQHIEGYVIPNRAVRKTGGGYRQINTHATNIGNTLSYFSKHDLFVDDQGILRAPKKKEIGDTRVNLEKRNQEREKRFKQLDKNTGYIYFSEQWWYVEWKNWEDFLLDNFDNIDSAVNTYILGCKKPLYRPWAAIEFELVENSLPLDKQACFKMHGSDLIIFPTLKRQLSKHDVKKFALTHRV
jgi:hypothetical protein